MREKSRASSLVSSRGIKIEKVKYDPKMFERKGKKKCCGR
jgi:hypothetical protein